MSTITGIVLTSMSAAIGGGTRQVSHCLAGFVKPFSASFFILLSSALMSMPSASHTMPSQSSLGTVSKAVFEQYGEARPYQEFVCGADGAAAGVADSQHHLHEIRV